jgi:hypothetical protein
MKSETVRTVILVSTLGLVGYLIDQKLRKEIVKEPVKEPVKENILVMESLKDI